jgi:hypothetical protein
MGVETIIILVLIVEQGCGKSKAGGLIGGRANGRMI